MELLLCHYPGTKNFEIAPNLLKKLCTAGFLFVCSVTHEDNIQAR